MNIPYDLIIETLERLPDAVRTKMQREDIGFNKTSKDIGISVSSLWRLLNEPRYNMGMHNTVAVLLWLKS